MSDHVQDVGEAVRSVVAAVLGWEVTMLVGTDTDAVSARFARATGECLQLFLHQPIDTGMRVLYVPRHLPGSHAICSARGRRGGVVNSHLTAERQALPPLQGE